ncbi:ankyrin repeat domain-containing protein [Flavisolibacter sp. BT320]|nr:ankyrin repeat domain-containing protein [Flavisolibacter longurius]
MSDNAIFDACRNGDLETVKSLVAENPALVNNLDPKGFTPLILAAYNEQTAIVEFLLQAGADPNLQDAAGNTALMGIAFKGYKEIAKKLIDAGADVNVCNSNGAPALTFAATFGHLQIAEWLLQVGADMTLRDSRGKSPIDHAVAQDNEAMIELFQRYAPPQANA